MEGGTMHRLRLLCSTALITASLFSTQAWSWGTKGHETIEEVAIRLLPRSSFSQLLENNLAAVKFTAMVPDLHWKHGADAHPLEGQAHFFSYDFYSPRGGAIPTDAREFVARYGMEHVLKEGTAPFRMQQMAAVLLQTLKNPKATPTEIIQMAATLGHYVGDLGQPLHVSIDYDGVQIGRKGLHAYFETYAVGLIPEQTLIDEVTTRAQGYLPHIPDDVAPIIGGMGLAKGAHAKADVIYEYAKRLNLTPACAQAFVPTIYTTMAMSAAMLAKIWQEAYVLAGSPTINDRSVGSIPIPEWVPISYLKGNSNFLMPEY
jgi:hypothetical protein